MSIRIVLVDDHKVVVDGLCKYLANEDDIEIAGVAMDGRDALDLVLEHQPNLVVMDVTMPGLNGLEATRQILKRSPRTAVLGLSMHTNPQTARQMLQAGARGYITKSAPIEEVIDAIHAVGEGRYYISQDLAHHFPELEFIEPGDSVPMPASGLSAREREVLQLVVEGKSSKEVGKLLHVTTKTIEHHRHNIMQKLRIDSIPDLTKYAIREGLTSLET